ncbi:MAG: cobalamin-dependent protein, partial [Desulforhabdus sp.]|nr:cobalamin-dependent protein [Desulforhabdus sp.]
MKALLTVPLPRLIQDPPRYPDLGLGYLARHLEANGHEVFIHGWNSRLTPAEFSGMLRELEPDVVGIKVFTHNFNAVRATMALISQTLPQTPIILGGPHVSATEPKEIFIDFPMTSYALRGEAEATLPTLLMHLQGRSVSLNDIPGLVWMEKQQVKFNSPVWTKNLDELGQPAWEKLYSNRTDHKLGRWQRQKSAPLTASRGCPGSCAFCSVHKISGNRVRSRSAEAILEEIEYLAGRYRVQNFIFMDTNFLFDRELTVAICEGILGRQLRVSWDCVSDYSWYKCDPQLYRLMHRSGCRVMQVGIESGSDRVR